MQPSITSAVQRRHLLQAGALSTLGLTLPTYLRHTAAAEVRETKAKAAIVIFLGGGPPHLDTFDMKPHAPAELRGEFKPIGSNVPGISVCEHLPKLAQCADKYAVLRVSHTQAAHELATNYLSTGNRPVPSLVYPGYGAVISKELPGARDLPHFVAVPETAQKAGYLGVRYAPLSTTDVPKAGQPFSVRGIALENGLTVANLERGQDLLNRLDTTFKGFEKESRLIAGLDRFSQQAYDLLTSPKAREAFDVSREAPAIAEAFGESRFGMSCLLAARLIEAGVKFTTVSYGGWDTHANNFKQCKEKLLPPLDQGLAALFQTLAQRGLLETTSILVTGEFGRTPKINDKAGRDHWPRSMFMLLAGGAFRTGQIAGESDENGMGPVGEPITPEQVAATFYRSLGIDHRHEYHTSTGRPVMIVREGSVLPQLLAS